MLIWAGFGDVLCEGTPKKMTHRFLQYFLFQKCHKNLCSDQKIKFGSQILTNGMTILLQMIASRETPTILKGC